MKILLLGCHGQVGWELQRSLSVLGDVVALHRGSASLCGDLSQPDALAQTVRSVRPDVIVNAAAHTAVDKAESEPELARLLNATAPGVLAREAAALDALLVHYSTDYVFDGSGDAPRDEDAPTAPLSVYGQTKLEGEQAVSSTLEKYFIVRIAWVFGLNGKNFIKTMLGLSEKYDTIRVVNDQVGTPTYTFDLARLLVDMIETDKYGYYHATNEGGYISWYDFTCEIFRQAGRSTQVIPVTTEEYGLSKAARPFNSRLDKQKLAQNGFEPLPTWQDALSRYLTELGVTQ